MSLLENPLYNELLRVRNIFSDMYIEPSVRKWETLDICIFQG